MHVNCSTCLELLSPSDEISSAPCGHIFHTPCILQWLETGKSNCPQCRTSCRKNQLRRIFLTEAADVSSQTSDKDGVLLQNKLDSLAFELRLSKQEKNAVLEKFSTVNAQAVCLREELRDIEQALNKAKEETAAYKSQNRLLQCEKKKADLAKKEAEEVRVKLELYKNIEFIVNASNAEVNHKMHQMGDFSRTAKELSYMIVTLNKVLEDRGREVAQLRRDVNQKSHKIDELKTSVQMLTQANSKLAKDNERISSDCYHLTEEVESLKGEVGCLRDAVTSPSGDPKNSALCRLLGERPKPQFIKMVDEENKKLNQQSDKKEDEHAESDDLLSPFQLSTKQCSLVMLSKIKSSAIPSNNTKQLENTSLSSSNNLLKKNARSVFLKRPRIDDLASPSSFSAANASYNGMGGHSKPDYFPQPLVDLKINGTFKKHKKLSKKPKGISRPASKIGILARKI